LLQLEPTATFRATGRRIYFVLSGTGRVGGDNYRRLTTVLCERGEETSLKPAAATEMLVLGLPKLESSAPHAVAAQ
jgi:hypothetical protein